LISETTDAFWRHLAQLPGPVRRQAELAYRQFEQDPYYPSLHFRRLRAGHALYSARIGEHYRALAIVENGRAQWFWIGSHAEYDQILRRF